MAVDQVYPIFYQLDQSMGTNIADYTNPGVPKVGVPGAQECAMFCTLDTSCVSTTYVYTTIFDAADLTGTCYIFYEGSDLNMVLAVKALPFDTISGSSISGQAAVASGSYIIFIGHAEADMYGQPISTFGATVGNSASGTDHSAADCKDACDNDGSCWGFYHLEGTPTPHYCYLRTGFDGQGARSFMHMVKDRVDTTDPVNHTPYP
jgi:hypothetical protein